MRSARFTGEDPSFNVNPHKQIFHCFGCHKGGDVFTFVQEYESPVSPKPSGAWLSGRKSRSKSTASLAQQNRFVKETLLQIHDQIAQRWHTHLLNDAGGEPGRATSPNARRPIGP